MFIRACHQFLSWAKWIQFITFHPVPLRYILILSSQLQTDFPVYFFSGFPTKTLFSCLCPAMCAEFLIHSILHFTTLKQASGDKQNAIRFSIWNVLQLPVTFSLLGPNISLSILFSSQCLLPECVKWSYTQTHVPPHTHNTRQGSHHFLRPDQIFLIFCNQYLTSYTKWSVPQEAAQVSHLIPHLCFHSLKQNCEAHYTCAFCDHLIHVAYVYVMP